MEQGSSPPTELTGELRVLLRPPGNEAAARALASTKGEQRQCCLTTAGGGGTLSAEPQGRRAITSSHQTYQALRKRTLFRASLTYQTN